MIGGPQGGTPPSSTKSPELGDDRKQVMFSDFPNLSDLSAPPERPRAAARPLASSEKQGAAAAKAFGVVVEEGDSVSASEIGLALKRVAEHVAGTDKAQQLPAVKLVRKEWQHLAKFGSLRDRNSFIFGFLLATDGLDSPYGKALVARMRRTLDSDADSDAEMLSYSQLLQLSSETATLSSSTTTGSTPTVTSSWNGWDSEGSHRPNRCRTIDADEGSTSSGSSDFRKLNIV
jgi:hypothetical protein